MSRTLVHRVSVDILTSFTEQRCRVLVISCALSEPMYVLIEEEPLYELILLLHPDRSCRSWLKL